MASLQWTVLLICLAAHWTEATDKELGQPCTVGTDTCVHPTLETVCDQEKTCKIRQGQACNGAGYSTLCVAGAECDSGTNVCTCKGSVYSNDSSTGKCAADAAAKYAGACDSASPPACPAGDNLVCDGTTVCVCTKTGGFTPDLGNGKCTAITTAKVGKACTAAADCPTASNLVCDTASTPKECVCSSGYTGPRGGDCVAIGQQLVGKTCTADATAANTDKCGPADTTNLGCTGGSTDECACASGYYGVTGGACYPANNRLGGGCSTSTGCAATDANSECSGTPKTCQCKTGYFESSGMCCKNSGAAGLVGSLATVVLAAILHVFMRD